MSYAVFPALIGITWNLKKRPNWSTAVMTTAAGNEFRTRYRQYPISEFDLSYSYMSLNDKLTMEGFFNTQQGRLTPFYFDAQNDDTITVPFGFGTSDGVTLSWTLFKSAGNGGIEPIGGQTGTFGVVTAPGVTVLFDNGTAIPTSHYSVSDGGAGSVVTFTSGNIPLSGHVMTWTGQYRYLVRFGDDKLEFNQFANQMYEVQDCTLQVVR